MFLNYHLEGDIWFRNMNYINSWTFGLVSCFLIKNCLLNDNSETWAHDSWFSWFLMNPLMMMMSFKNNNFLIFRQNHISGVAAHRTPLLFNSPMSRESWKYLLREASSLHFTASHTAKHFPNIDREDPESSAYSLLAPYLCPVALNSNEMQF